MDGIVGGTESELREIARMVPAIVAAGVIAVVVHGVSIRKAVKKRALPYMAAMSGLGGLVAAVFSVPIAAVFWRSLPGRVLENPLHRWWAGGKIEPWTDAVVLAIGVIAGTAVSWLVVWMGGKRPGMWVVGGLAIGHAAGLVAAVWLMTR